jgi:SpoIIAA-like
VGAPPISDLYLDEPWVSIRWNDVHHCVYTKWKAFATSAEFRAALMRALDAIRDHQAVGYVSDTRKIKVIVHKDQAWANEVWIPLLVAEGVKRFALVTAASGLGKAAVEDVIKLVDNRGLLMQGFDSLDEARKWLALAKEGQP